ncbi:MAG: hypothetical protein LBT26_05345 [Clostridiales Family XIII bacterium]|jgi:hypothetical protein|nr:hypothetical protein [Clostridiales Family XIII bacterium]
MALTQEERNQKKQETDAFMQRSVTVDRIADAVPSTTDYHQHLAVHEGEQFFFASAYEDRFRTVTPDAKYWDAKDSEGRFKQRPVQKPVLDETGSKKERERKKQAHPAAMKEWADFKRQSYYDEAGDAVERQLVEDRRARSEEDVWKLQEETAYQAEPDAEPADLQAQYSWIGIQFCKWDESDVRTGMNPEDVQEASARQLKICEALTNARDILLEEEARTQKDEAKLQVLRTLSKRLALCANNYALNEREMKALRRMDHDAVMAGMTASGEFGVAGESRDEIYQRAVSARGTVQANIREILFNETKGLTRLLQNAKDGVGVTDSRDKRYLENCGIQADTQFNILQASVEETLETDEKQDEKQGEKQDEKDEKQDEKDEQEEERRRNALLAEQAAFFERAMLGLRALAGAEAETRLSYLVDIEENAFCGPAQKEKIEDLIEQEFKEDKKVASVVKKMEDQMDVAKKKIKAAQSTLKLPAADRAALMLETEETLTQCQQERELLAAMAGLTEGEEQERKGILRARLYQGRMDAYETYAKNLTEIQKELRFAKYRRAASQRITPDRDSFKTAQSIVDLKLKPAELTNERLNAILSSLADDTLTDEDRQSLAKNLDRYLTRKLRAPFDAAVNRLATQGSQRSEEDKKVIRAAARYILTVEDNEALAPQLREASADALAELEHDLRLFKWTDLSAEQALDRKSALTMGEILDTFRKQGRKSLLDADFQIFSEKLDAIAEGRLSAYKTALAGSEPLLADTASPEENMQAGQALDALLLEGGLHPGILQQFGALDMDARRTLLKELTGEPSAAVAALDRLMLQRPDLDNLCFALKQKALRGVFQKKDAAGGAAGGTPAEDAAEFKLKAAHDGSRLARTCRVMAQAERARRKKGDPLAVRLEKLEAMDDRAMLEILLSAHVSEDDDFLLINAYALLLSAEKGAMVTAVELKNAPGCATYDLAYLDTALSSKLAKQADYYNAKDLMQGEMDLYDSRSMGNRFRNFLGDVVGRDLSQERMGMRALRGMLRPDGHYEANELLHTEMRDMLDLTTGDSVDLGQADMVRLAIQGTDTAFYENGDLGRQLARAGAAALYQERESEKSTAEEEEKKAEAERKIAERRVAADARYARIQEEAKEQGKMESLFSARKERSQTAGLGDEERGETVALCVLGIQHLLERATAPKATPEAEDWKSFRDSVRELRGKLPKWFDLSAMTEDSKERKDSATYKTRRQYKDRLDALGKAKEPSEFNSLAKSMLAIYYGTGSFALQDRAEAALQVEAESGFDMAKAIGDVTAAKGAAMKDVRSHLTRMKMDFETKALKRADDKSGDALLEEARTERMARYTDPKYVKRGEKAIDADTDKPDSTLALSVLGLRRVLERSETAEEGNWKSLRDAIGAIRDTSLHSAFNLLAMTMDPAQLRDTRVYVLRDEFKKKLDELKSAKDLDNFHVLAADMRTFFQKYRLADRAEAALGTDAFLTSETLQAEAAERAVGKDAVTADVRAHIQQDYAHAVKKGLKERKEEAKEKTGEGLLEEARVVRRSQYGIKDDEKGGAVALSVMGIREILKKAVEVSRETPEKEWTDLRTAIKQLHQNLPAHFNLDAMTQDDKKLAEQSVHRQRRQFKEMLGFAEKAATASEFADRARELQAFYQWHSLSERAEAALDLEAPEATAEARAEDLKTAMKGVTAEHLPKKMKKYYDKKAERFVERTDVSGIELIETAREDRAEKYGIQDDENGATLALSILAIQFLSEKAKRTNEDEWKGMQASFKVIRDKLPEHFNLRAMTRDSDKLGGTHVHRLRRRFKYLIDTISACDSLANFKSSADALWAFYAQNSLSLRASAALEVKADSQKFDEKAENAVGKSEDMAEVRAHLKETYADKLGREMVVKKGPESQMSRSLQKRIESVAEVVALRMFQEAFPPVSFDTFVKNLADKESQDFQSCRDRLAQALDEASFEKKRDPAAPGEKYKPLNEERARALAGFAITGFADKMKKETGGAGAWLTGKAQKHSDHVSRQILLTEKRIGAEAASALGKMQKEMTAVQVVDTLQANQVLTLTNFSGGSVKLGGKITEMTVGFSLAAALENEISVTCGEDGKMSIYIGKACQGEVAGRIGADVRGFVKAEAGVALSLSGASGMCLDFSDRSKCGEFLGRLFNNGAAAEKHDLKHPEKDGAPAAEDLKPEGMLALCEKIRPIRQYAGGIKMDIGISLGEKFDDVGSVFGDLLKEIGPVQAAADYVGAKVEALTEMAKEKGTVVAQGVSGQVRERVTDNIHAPLTPEMEQLVGKSGEEISDTIRTTLSDAMQEQVDKVPEMIGGIPEKISDAVQEKAQEKAKEMAEALLGEEKKDEDEDEKDEEKSGLKDKIKEAAEKAKEAAEEKAKEAAKEKAKEAKGKVKEKFFGKKSEEEKKDGEDEDDDDDDDDDEEEEFKLMDLALTAGLSLAASYKTEKSGMDEEKVTNSTQIDAQASVTAAFLGAERSKSAEGRFDAELERRYTGGKLTGATMTRRYRISGSGAARETRELLYSYGIQNASLYNDLKDDFSGCDDMVLILDAELTQGGMEKYHEAEGEGSTLKEMLCLSDRRNYRNTAVSIEMPISSASMEHAVQVGISADAVLTGGEAEVGFKTGARGGIRQKFKYNARGRVGG